MFRENTSTKSSYTEALRGTDGSPFTAAGFEALESAIDKTARGLTLTSAESTALLAAQSSVIVSTVQSRLDANLDALEAHMGDRIEAELASR